MSDARQDFTIYHKRRRVAWTTVLQQVKISLYSTFERKRSTRTCGRMCSIALYGLYINRKIFLCGPGAIAARAGKAGIYRERAEKREECLQQPKTQLFKKRRVSGALTLWQHWRAPPRAAAPTPRRNAGPGTRHSVFCIRRNLSLVHEDVNSRNENTYIDLQEEVYNCCIGVYGLIRQSCTDCYDSMHLNLDYIPY